MNVVPSPGVLFAVMLPLCRSTILRQTVTSHPRSVVGALSVQTLEKSEDTVKVAFVKTDAVIFKISKHCLPAYIPAC
jgi:hypothetical protein